MVHEHRVARGVAVARHHHLARVGGEHGRRPCPRRGRVPKCWLCFLPLKVRRSPKGAVTRVLARPGEVARRRGRRAKGWAKAAAKAALSASMRAFTSGRRLDVLAGHLQLARGPARGQHLQALRRAPRARRWPAPSPSPPAARRLLHRQAGEGLEAVARRRRSAAGASERARGGLGARPAHGDEHRVSRPGRRWAAGRGGALPGGEGGQAEGQQEEGRPWEGADVGTGPRDMRAGTGEASTNVDSGKPA